MTAEVHADLRKEDNHNIQKTITTDKVSILTTSIRYTSQNIVSEDN